MQLVGYNDSACGATPVLRPNQSGLAVTWVVVIVGIRVTDRSTGAAPVPVMETNAFTAALAQVATGTAATIAPVRLADNLPIADNAVRLPLVAPVLTKPIGLLLARRDPELPAVAALIAALATAGPGPR